MLKLLLYCVLLHTVFAQIQSRHGFGTSYLKNSRLCRPWTCINTNLGLPDALPPKEQYSQVLKDILPQGSWQNVIPDVIEKCYGDRPRRYTNTCPGQALLHCTVDHLIQFCPEGSLRKDDACAPLQTLAGFKYMFTQSRYDNLEKNLPAERRPSWFLKNYFSSKCCDLPAIFKSDVLQECGFTSFLFYHVHEPNHGPMTAGHFLRAPRTTTTTPKSDLETDIVKVVAFNENHIETTQTSNKVVDGFQETERPIDPLECCDVSGFIQASWRSECGFTLSWDKDTRLSIAVDNSTQQVSTTVAPSTARPGKMNDVKIIPPPCEQSTCVFKKLNVIKDNGSLDIDSFSKLLDNMTIAHTSWTKAKARVITKCLAKPLREYVDECEINKVLACTFDVLSENCPHAKKQDPCRHSAVLKENMTCQISSSKFRPKNRRQFCGIPSMVGAEVLVECGVTSLARMEYVPEPVTSRPGPHWWSKSKFACKGSTDSTKCLLKKMGVLNKYGFLDYFKMKDRIRSFTGQDIAWSSLSDVYLNTFTSIPMYGEQCSTPKKLLNVLDAMLMTCPMSKRKPRLQCNRILTDMASTPTQQNLTKEKTQQIREHFEHVYNFPTFKSPVLSFKINVTGNLDNKQPEIHKNPAYDFGILNSKDAPKVEIISVKPKETKKPLVLLPVYMTMRLNGKNKNTTYMAPMRDGIWRSAPIYPPVPNMP